MWSPAPLHNRPVQVQIAHAWDLLVICMATFGAYSYKNFAVHHPFVSPRNESKFCQIRGALVSCCRRLVDYWAAC